MPPPLQVAAESAAALWAVTNRPQEYAGVARKASHEEADWLANCALWYCYEQYAGKKLDPADTDGVEAWHRLRAMVQQHLLAAAPVAWTRSEPVWPVQTVPRTKFKSGSKFGVKRPWKGTTTRHHCGIDLGAPLGAEVYAPEDATVVGETGWEETVKAVVVACATSGIVVLMGGIKKGSAPPRGTVVSAGARIGVVAAYPKGSTMAHVQTMEIAEAQGGLPTLAQVEKRKKWLWQAEPPPGLFDANDYLVAAARRSPVNQSAVASAFAGLGEDDEADEDLEQNEGVGGDAGASAEVDGGEVDAGSGGGDGGGGLLLVSGLVFGYGAYRAFRRR